MRPKILIVGDTPDLGQKIDSVLWHNAHKSPLSPVYRPFTAPISKVRSGSNRAIWSSVIARPLLAQLRCNTSSHFRSTPGVSSAAAEKMAMLR
jgi:hypothetical protein